MKHYLQTILEEAGYNTRSYSGRGMYGKECLGVVIKNNKVGVLFSSVLTCIREDMEDTYDFFTNYSTLEDAFGDMATDNMGIDTIVYFPSVPYIDED